MSIAYLNPILYMPANFKVTGAKRLIVATPSCRRRQLQLTISAGYAISVVCAAPCSASVNRPFAVTTSNSLQAATAAR